MDSDFTSSSTHKNRDKCYFKYIRKNTQISGARKIDPNHAIFSVGGLIS